MTDIDRMIVETTLATRNDTDRELNTPYTRSFVVRQLEEYLLRLKTRRSLYDYKVVCDRTNNTEDSIARNELVITVFWKDVYGRAKCFDTRHPDAVNSLHEIHEIHGERMTPEQEADLAQSIDTATKEINSLAPRNIAVPGAGDWTFKNADVAQHFDAHVREQLPWYDLASGIMAHFGRHYLPEHGKLYDLGASTGHVTKMLEHEIRTRQIDAVSLDYSEAMSDKWQGVGAFVVADARAYDYHPFDFCVCFLVLMFMPPYDQSALLERLVSKIKPGGAIMIFDKTQSEAGYIGTIMARLTLAGKMSQGANPVEVIQKELSLSGVQRPIQPSVLLAKYEAVEVFRFGEFAGWIIQG